ncbi:MAG: glycosyltransferase, partial [Chitinophagaceae bacterium]|nr:glycosyltransferase [Chitinophagaceae bacterium]
SKAGAKVSCIPAKNNFLILLRLPWIIRYVRLNKIDLIHCHLPVAGIVGRLVKRITGVPLLYTEHNIQESYHRTTRLLNRLTYSWQNEVIAVSGSVAGSIQRNISSKVPVRVLPNGINVNEFVRDVAAGQAVRKKMRIPEQALVVGTVAVFRPHKRLDKWMEIFTRARQKNENLFALIVGDGPLRSELELQISRLGLSNYLFLTGLQVDVKPWLSAMDIFMMTSAYEGLPVALLEAMSMECAIVSTAVGGIGEVVRHGVDGFLASENDFESIAAFLTHVACNPLQIQKMGKSARAWVENSYNLTAMVQNLEDIYELYVHPKEHGSV